MKRTMMLWAMGLSVMATYAQWETDGNATLDPDDSYIGTNDNVPLNFRTDSIARMRLWRTQSNTINGFAGIKQNGYLGISPNLRRDSRGTRGPCAS